MDRTEFAKIALAIRVYYGRDNFLISDQAKELWYRQLQDLDYRTMEQAVNKYAATNKYPPTIADLRSMCVQTLNDDWGQGWQEVIKAIQCYGAWNVQGALDSMSPTTRKVVERLGFYELCNSENLTADRANFRELYEKIAERDRKEQIALGVSNVRLIEGD